jgi:hypothetical protein
VVLALAGTFSFGSVWATPSWHQATGIGSTVDMVYESSTNNIFAIVQGTSAGVYKSTDGAQSFSLVKSFTTPYRVNLGAGGGVRLWVGTSAGLYKTSDLSTWSLVSGGLPSGGAVTFVGTTINSSNSLTMWATVTGVTTRGLYRSTDQGANWSRVIVKAAPNIVVQGNGCGTAMAQTVFAGGPLSLGGPSCTLLKSTDDGATFSCTTYSHTVNDLTIDCYSGSTQGHLYTTAADPATAAGSVGHSADQGSTFSDDGTGLSSIGANNIADDDLSNYEGGIVVGSYDTGLYSRLSDVQGTSWTQSTTTGLSDLHIKKWVRYSVSGTFKYFVVGTPSGVFYLN